MIQYAKVCACGEPYSVNHCFTCKKGGYMNLRHNSLRDLLAEVLDEIGDMKIPCLMVSCI